MRLGRDTYVSHRVKRNLAARLVEIVFDFRRHFSLGWTFLVASQIFVTFSQANVSACAEADSNLGNFSVYSIFGKHFSLVDQENSVICYQGLLFCQRLNQLFSWAGTAPAVFIVLIRYSNQRRFIPNNLISIQARALLNDLLRSYWLRVLCLRLSVPRAVLDFQN